MSIAGGGAQAFAQNAPGGGTAGQASATQPARPTTQTTTPSTVDPFASPPPPPPAREERPAAPAPTEVVPRPSRSRGGQGGEEPEAETDSVYASKGQKTIRGRVDVASTSSSAGAGASAVAISTSSVFLAPTVGYFVLDRVELAGSLLIEANSTNADTATTRMSNSDHTLGLELSALYHAPLTGLAYLVGGSGLGYSTGSSTNGATTVDLTSRLFELFGGIELAFGHGGWGTVSLTAGWQYTSISTGAAAGGDSSRSQVGLSAAFGVAFE